jgi:parvulin-like peptidyl-prolyl isomerase
MKLVRFLLVPAALLALAAAGCGGGGSKSSNATTGQSTTATSPAPTTPVSVPSSDVNCPSSKTVPASDVAEVCGTGITRTQLDRLLAQAKQSYKTQKRPFPPVGTSEYVALRDQAIRFLVQRVEFEQQAAKLGVKVTDKDIADRLALVKKQCCGGDESKYKKALAAQGVTDQDVRDDVRSTLISEALVKKVTQDIKVSDGEVSRYYQQNMSQYRQPESRRVRHILVKSKALANKLYAQLKGGADFAKLAKKYSQDPGSKQVGGEYTDTKGTFVAPFEKVAFALKTNQLSKPVHTQFGWHLIQALGPIVAAKTTPLSQVRTAIRQQLLQTAKTTASSEWAKQVDATYSNKIDYQTGFAPAPATGSTSPSATTG